MEHRQRQSNVYGNASMSWLSVSENVNAEHVPTINPYGKGATGNSTELKADSTWPNIVSV